MHRHYANVQFLNANPNSYARRQMLQVEDGRTNTTSNKECINTVAEKAS